MLFGVYVQTKYIEYIQGVYTKIKYKHNNHSVTQLLMGFDGFHSSE